MENYLRHKFLGGNIMIKKGVVPHKFDCQPDRNLTGVGKERATSVRRQRKKLVEELIAAETEKHDEESVGDFSASNRDLELGSVYFIFICGTTSGLCRIVVTVRSKPEWPFSATS